MSFSVRKLSLLVATAAFSVICLLSATVAAQSSEAGSLRLSVSALAKYCKGARCSFFQVAFIGGPIAKNSSGRICFAGRCDSAVPASTKGGTPALAAWFSNVGVRTCGERVSASLVYQGRRYQGSTRIAC